MLTSKLDDFIKMTPKELIAQHIASQKSQTPRVRNQIQEGAFNATSLKQWIQIAVSARIPFIKVIEMASVDIVQLLNFENETVPNEAMDVLHALNDEVLPPEMLRFDCCAPLGLKMAIEHKTSISALDKEDKFLHPGDPRAFDLLYEYPCPTISILKRPIIKTMMHDGFPVEFRVFVKDGIVEGVSNYYPQVSLPESIEVMGWALKSYSYAMKMVKEITDVQKLKQHYNPNLVSDDLNVTLDFLVTEAGELLFLEGGPGFGFGAHPCCFHDPITNETRDPIGIVLAPAGKAIPVF